jgi:16S rRNA (cytosine1402-N4)-methyltransferase
MGESRGPQPDPHTTVLLQEAVDALITEENGLYIDGTFGRGGHSRLILQRLSEQGQLLAIDKDKQAVAWAQQQFANDSRFDVEQGSFTQLYEIIKARNKLNQVNGVLLDLGVSSPQLDDAERGFSFMRDGELDMRMDADTGVSAADWLRIVKENELARILKEYGDEKFAKRIARAIVAARETSPITRTQQLADIVATAHPAWEPGKHPATKSFLAIRLFINRELEDLTILLNQVVDILAPRGRLVVISFHSLEDRIVKRFIKEAVKGKAAPRRLPIRDEQLQKRMKSGGRPIRPGDAELAINPRARSAIMRVAEKLP